MSTRAVPSQLHFARRRALRRMKNQMGGNHDRLEAALRGMPRPLGSTPKVVLVVSGHWEEGEVTVMYGSRPPMRACNGTVAR